MKTVALCIAFLGLVNQTSAQLLAAKDHKIAMGHHHLWAEDVAKDKAFWLSLGGESVEFHDYHVIRFPNVLIFLREAAPSAGTDGAVVNHVGLQFPDLRGLVKKLHGNGTPIITKEVVRDNYETDAEGLAFNPAADTYLAFARAPNGTRVELYETKDLKHAVANHHIHFYGPEVDAMKAWYVEKLGAKPGQRSGMEAADLGGVNLTFSPSETKLAGTKERALDHIGFEIDGLEALCKKLEAQGVKFDRPYSKIERLGIAVAFFTDPWGTYVELTEGLDGI